MDATIKIACIGGDELDNCTIQMHRCLGETLKEKYKDQLGCNFSSYSLNDKHHQYTVQICELTDNEIFRDIQKEYYSGSRGILAFFDLQNPDSFKTMKSMIEDALDVIQTEIQLLIIGTSPNQEEQPNVSEDDILEFVSDIQLSTGLDIDYEEIYLNHFCFRDLVDRLIRRIGDQIFREQLNVVIEEIKQV